MRTPRKPVLLAALAVQAGAALFLLLGGGTAPPEPTEAAVMVRPEAPLAPAPVASADAAPRVVAAPPSGEPSVPPLRPAPPRERLVRGRVEDERGEPIEGARVLARAVVGGEGLISLSLDPLPSLRAEDTTDALGRFVLRATTGEPTGLTAQAPGRSQRGGARLLDAQDDDVVLVLGPGGRVHGTVRGDDGAPLVHARVRALPDGPSGSDTRGAVEVHETYSDGAGAFDLDGLLPEVRWRLSASASGRAQVEAPRSVRVAGEIRWDPILSVGGTIEGTVVDADTGLPVAGAAVVASVQEQGAAGTETRLSSAAATSGPDGRFVLGPLLPGEVRLARVAAPGYAPRSLFAGAGEPWGAVGLDEPLRVRVALGRGASVLGTVSDASGRPQPAAVVSLLDPLSGATGTRTAVADETGAYRFDGVPTDVPVGVSLRRPERPALTAALLSLRLVEGETLQVDLEAPADVSPPGPTREIVGLVTDVEGRPVERAFVVAGEGSFPSDAPDAVAHALARAVTDADGRFHLVVPADAVVSVAVVSARGFLALAEDDARASVTQVRGDEEAVFRLRADGAARG